MKIFIVIPTYNERENVIRLLERLEELSIPGGERHVLIVDDNSPDGTGRVADEAQRRYPWLEVLHRPGKGGLGRAYIAGFKQVLAAGADLIVQMDADFSHDPQYIPALVAAASTSDVVIGSRYVRGGGTKNWGVHRQILSRFGNVYARSILGLPSRDVTGGFRCYHRAALEAIDLSRIESVGYCFQIETLYRAYQSGCIMSEIPIIFVDRTAGASKMDYRIMFENFWRVWRLRLRR